MGVFCSKISVVDRSPSEITLRGYAFTAGEHYQVAYEGHGKVQSFKKTMPLEDNMEMQFIKDPFPVSQTSSLGSSKSGDRESRLSRSSSQKSKSSASKLTASPRNSPKKVSEVSSLLGRASNAGLGMAVEVLDTLGSSMTSLNSGSGFVSGATTKGNKISILAFEVANTIVKGANLMQSLSKESIKHLKGVVLPSEGVQLLVSKDINELLRTAAADKREELKVFAGEVIRFGNRCKDPQWHNLDRYFAKMESEHNPQPQLKEAAPMTMQYLMSLVRYTAELYHELHALDKFEQDYRRKLQEEGNSFPDQRGENSHILRQELKSQRKHVKSLKKKSLWSKTLENIMVKLVDIVHFLHSEIHDAFGNADGQIVEGSNKNQKRLGSAGLSLHYANIITQIDTLVSRSGSVPPNTRDALYQGLPASIKIALRPKLQSFEIKEELTVPQIKAEMEKTLQWLVPVATNTSRAHHGFGWVGEWANTGIETSRKSGGHMELLKIETLHHADKEKTEAYILDLVIWLHHLISQCRPMNGIRSPNKSPIRSPPKRRRSPNSSPPNKVTLPSSKLTLEEKEVLRDVNFRKLAPGISKSQEFDTCSRLSKHDRLSKSSNHSPTTKKEPSPMSQPAVSAAIFDIDTMKILDAIDRVDTLTTI